MRKIDKSAKFFANGDCKADDRTYIDRLESFEYG